MAPYLNCWRINGHYNLVAEIIISLIHIFWKSKDNPRLVNMSSCQNTRKYIYFKQKKSLGKLESMIKKVRWYFIYLQYKNLFKLWIVIKILSAYPYGKQAWIFDDSNWHSIKYAWASFEISYHVKLIDIFRIAWRGIHILIFTHSQGNSVQLRW